MKGKRWAYIFLLCVPQGEFIEYSPPRTAFKEGELSCGPQLRTTRDEKEKEEMPGRS